MKLKVGQVVIVEETGHTAYISMVGNFPRTTESEPPPDGPAYYLKEEPNGPSFGPFSAEQLTAVEEASS